YMNAHGPASGNTSSRGGQPPPVTVAIEAPPLASPGVESLDDDSMWPLDLGVAALVGVTLYLVTTRLDFDDPIWWRNAWTYIIAAPLLGLISCFLSRLIASRVVRRSVQFGLIGSLFLHLCLAVLAIHYVVFIPYTAKAMTGVKPERSPIRKTVPEYLFKSRERTRTAADWTRPTEVDTSSTIKPIEPRKLPPVQTSRERLELPTKQRPTESQVVHLKRQKLESAAKPQPSDSPSKRARGVKSPRPQLSNQSVEVPKLARAPENAVDQAMAARMEPARRSSKSRSRVNIESRLPPRTQPPAPMVAIARREIADLPTPGSSNRTRPRRRSQANMTRTAIAGSVPDVASVPIARESPTATRALDAMAPPTPMRRQRSGRNRSSFRQQAIGAGSQIAETDSLEPTAPVESLAAGMPDLVAPAQGGRGGGSPRRNRRPQTGIALGDEAVEVPEIAYQAGQGTDQGDITGDSFGPLMAQSRRGSAPASSDQLQSLSDLSAADLDLLLDPGPVGFADAAVSIAGVVPDEQAPTEVASLDLSMKRRRRATLGGPVLPAGATVAAVESFSRRVARTAGGAAPAPAGAIGPDTEEAIELGLAYLASTQNRDGSWSLQSDEAPRVLRSDTAATGLALLAFQGAGYTHRQHQYADTVARGVEWMMENQRSNGSLYRPEDPRSDGSVEFYSHGIAALAMSEAYGMTQDERIKASAQAALDFIVRTQHKKLGGWRYTPQVSSDTSVTGWMMMALKSGDLSGLDVPQQTYDGIERWLNLAQLSEDQADRYRYNPFAPDTDTQRHGKWPTPTITAVGVLMRMYGGWRRDNPDMRSAADYLLNYRPTMGTTASPQRDAYYWYYATQVMFHMGGETWEKWNRSLNPILLESQVKDGPYAGSWDPMQPVPDRWARHAGRVYVTTMNLLNLEVYYRHLPIYEEYSLPEE
ncbi:MAG: hypothetical protein AAF958_00390, partial [Planctomycetota bacterium]